MTQWRLILLLDRLLLLMVGCLLLLLDQLDLLDLLLLGSRSWRWFVMDHHRRGCCICLKKKKSIENQIWKTIKR